MKAARPYPLDYDEFRHGSVTERIGKPLWVTDRSFRACLSHRIERTVPESIRPMTFSGSGTHEHDRAVSSLE